MNKKNENTMMNCEDKKGCCRIANQRIGGLLVVQDSGFRGKRPLSQGIPLETHLNKINSSLGEQAILEEIHSKIRSCKIINNFRRERLTLKEIPLKVHLSKTSSRALSEQPILGEIPSELEFDKMIMNSRPPDIQPIFLQIFAHHVG